MLNQPSHQGTHTTPPLPPRRWLTLREAAEYLAVSERQVKYLIDRNGLAVSYAAGERCPRIDREDLDRFMAVDNRDDDHAE